MVKPFFRLGALAVLLLAAPALAQPADTILRNGTVHTVDAASRTAQAIALGIVEDMTAMADGETPVDVPVDHPH